MGEREVVSAIDVLGIWHVDADDEVGSQILFQEGAELILVACCYDAVDVLLLAVEEFRQLVSSSLLFAWRCLRLHYYIRKITSRKRQTEES